MFAAEVLEMLGDWEKLVNVYISAQQWEQVGLLCMCNMYVLSQKLLFQHV